MDHLRLEAGEIHIWRAALDRGDPGLAELLAPDEVERANRFVFEDDRRRFVVARASLRVLLGRYLDADPARVPIAYGENGKPELASRALEFNVTHAGELALIAFARDVPIGIDVERVKEDKVDELATVVCAPAERAGLDRLHGAERAHAFYVLWTQKEAFMKALGVGLSLEPNRVTVAMDAPAIVEAPGEADPAAWTVRTFDPYDGYVASYAARTPSLTPRFFEEDAATRIAIHRP